MPVSSVLHVLRTIMDRAPVSRTELQRLTGLSWGTVTNTTRQLLARNLIREEGALSTKAGRRPVCLTLNPAGHCLVGIEITPAAIRCLATNLAAEILSEELLPITPDDDPADLLVRTLDLVRRAQLAAAPRGLIGVGISFPGRICPHQGRVCGSPAMPRWNDVPVCALLESRLNLPVRLEHRTACLALAERWFGAGGADLLCVDLGESVSLGILSGGDVFRGHSGNAANFAHLSLDPAGPPCPCGNRGCVNAYCSVPSLLAFARHSPDPSPNPPPANPPAATIEELTARAAAGDAPARAAFDRMGHYLALALNNLIQLFDPALIVLAGTSTAAAPFFTPALHHHLAAHTIPHLRQPLISHLAPRAPALGACAAILQSTFTPDCDKVTR